MNLAPISSMKQHSGKSGQKAGGEEIMRPSGSISLTVFLFFSLVGSAFSWESKLVYYAGSSTLQYAADSEGNRIPDFSAAGYRGGCDPIPDVPVIATIGPVAGDNTSHIQAAIDWAGAQPLHSGVRGAVLLMPGLYRISGTIHVKKSGVVLRGSGSGNNPSLDTILYGTGDSPHQRTLIVLGGGSNTKWAGQVSGTKTNITQSVAVGSKTFRVAKSSAFSAGNNIIIYHPSAGNWVAAVNYGDTASDPPWKSGSVDILFNTHITAVDYSTNEITVDSPVFEHLDNTLSQAYIYKYDRSGIQTDIGIEDLRVDNDYKSATNENHVWQSIDFFQIEDAWARNVVATHFGQSGFRLATASRVTIENCQAVDPVSIVDAERRYNFQVYTATSNILFKDCYSRHGRHSFMSNGTSSVSGIVFQNCIADSDYTSSEGHRMWSMGLLYDNYQYLGAPPSDGGGRVLGLYNRGDMGSSHGWSASHSVVWNSDLGNGKLVVERPPTSQNYAIGCFADKGITKGPFSKPLGYVEGTGLTGLSPASLYDAQRAERCGY